MIILALYLGIIANFLNTYPLSTFDLKDSQKRKIWKWKGRGFKTHFWGVKSPPPWPPLIPPFLVYQSVFFDMMMLQSDQVSCSLSILVQNISQGVKCTLPTDYTPDFFYPSLFILCTKVSCAYNHSWYDVAKSLVTFLIWCCCKVTKCLVLCLF